MDSFYYNLLNIGKKSIKEEEYLNIIKEIVGEVSKSYHNDLDGLCKFISIDISDRLKQKNIDANIINTKDLYDMYEHQFVISSFIDELNNINYYLIDPTYIQFRHKDEYDFEVLYSADFLEKTDKKLFDDLFKDGYSKINNNDLKCYIGSLMYEEDINKIDLNIEDIILERRHK